MPKNRTDVLPHYSRLVATLSKYMPDIGTELVAAVRHITAALLIVADEFVSSMKSSDIFSAKRTSLRSLLILDAKT